MKKIERGQQFLRQNLALFQCPVCHVGYQTVSENSLICPNGHQLDLSKKGTLYFLQRQVQSEYDQAMLASRRRILQAGLFDGFLDVVREKLPQQAIGLDVGCGEGTPLHKLEDKLQTAIGFDISKAGVNLATQQETKAFFCVADLAHLPFNAATFDTILNIFSPSNYREFARIMRPGAQVIKVIPNTDYLAELRQALFAGDRRAVYSNEKVLAHFNESYQQVSSQRVRYQFNIPRENFADLVLMTPLHWQATPEQLQQLLAQPFPQITVDVTVLIGGQPVIN
ncbi:methyltransferase domain-containing protein [Loigolactobacillus zhaoyuanensis]|uniref:Methyltransferase domain-containing protein n=1 Tax=Loigolactobacillus zhaoyuanensis TaxID=2486017 RepID=A0ABW8UHS0_9LACO|nr:methyltransferase domain-containing protein [Loigolactobacillus zhaoyuanensis]